jgi:hypothetical protein
MSYNQDRSGTGDTDAYGSGDRDSYGSSNGDSYGSGGEDDSYVVPSRRPPTTRMSHLAVTTIMRTAGPNMVPAPTIRMDPATISPTEMGTTIAPPAMTITTTIAMVPLAAAIPAMDLSGVEC